MPPLRNVRLALWGLVVLLAASSAAVYFARLPASTDAPIVKVGGPFELTAEDGTRFSSTSLTGKPFIIYFGFTHCPDVCPTAMFEISEVLKDVGEPAKDLKVLFVSVDPERDTPQLLKDYTETFDPRIIGLTGSKEDIERVTKSYRVYYRKVPTGGSYTMDHTASLYLMDGKGQLVSVINHGAERKDAVEKVRRLLSRPPA